MASRNPAVVSKRRQRAFALDQRIGHQRSAVDQCAALAVS